MGGVGSGSLRHERRRQEPATVSVLHIILCNIKLHSSVRKLLNCEWYLRLRGLREEDDVTPEVCTAVLSLPPQTHIMMRYTAIHLTGELCEWIEIHPHHLGTCDVTHSCRCDSSSASGSSKSDIIHCPSNSLTKSACKFKLLLLEKRLEQIAESSFLSALFFMTCV